LRHLKVPCDNQEPPENRIENKNLTIIEEFIVVSLGKKTKTKICLNHSLLFSVFNNDFFGKKNFKPYK